jgi:hypothetical protein
MAVGRRSLAVVFGSSENLHAVLDGGRHSNAPTKHASATTRLRAVVDPSSTVSTTIKKAPRPTNNGIPRILTTDIVPAHSRKLPIN